MSVHIITDESSDMQVLYCSTTMQAFGPIFHSNQYVNTDYNDFLLWLELDARSYDEQQLRNLYYKWLETLEEDV